jgi:poly(A) polymerase
MEKLQTAGHIAYLVGGGVRDILLDKRPKDFDISTSAKPEEVKALFRNCILIGRRFRLAHIRFGKKVLEVSTFRTGDSDTEELILRDNDWGTPEQDVIRRDFTINGLFYNSEDETIIDFVGGYEDLKKKFLRTIGQATQRFRQDPVRMIRLLKFQARYGFIVDKESHLALLECRGDILKSSQARVLEELLRMTESGHSRSFYELMTSHGMLQMLLPNLSDFLETTHGQEVYSFLEEADRVILDPEDERQLQRPVLLASFIFPLVDRHFQTHIDTHGKSPHLGIIQHEISFIIDTIFRPFFHLPKRTRTSLLFILTSQFRITPLEEKLAKRIRIPGTPDFDLTLDFLGLRAQVEPGLQEIWSTWNEAFVKNPPERRPRLRRRSRNEKSDR